MTVAWPGHLRRPVNFQSRFLNHIQGYVEHIALAQFQPDLSVVEPLKTSSKNLLLMQWKTSLDSGEFPFEASIITLFGQFPVKTRRGNFQRVRKRDQVFNIELCSYLFTDQLAIEVRNAPRFVDEDSQERVLARSFEFRIN